MYMSFVTYGAHHFGGTKFRHKPRNTIQYSTFHSCTVPAEYREYQPSIFFINIQIRDTGQVTKISFPSSHFPFLQAIYFSFILFIVGSLQHFIGAALRQPVHRLKTNAGYLCVHSAKFVSSNVQSLPSTRRSLLHRTFSLI